jgi:hypothetical protein
MSSKVLSLAQRTGGAMSKGAYNVAEFPEFNQPYNTSSGATTGGARKKSTRQTPSTESKKPRKKSTRQMPTEVAESTTKTRKKKDPCDPKPKRKPSMYNMFVRDNMDKVLLLHLAPRDRMKKIAELWRSKNKN